MKIDSAADSVTLSKSSSTVRSNTQQGLSAPSLHSDFLCVLKFHNRVPDVPYDMKFLKYPFERDRFIKYKPTSLERYYMHDILTDVDQGLDIDLIDPEAYTFPEHLPFVPLTAEDRALLPEHVDQQLSLQQHTKSGSVRTPPTTLKMSPSERSTAAPLSPPEATHTQVPKSKPAAPWLRKTIYAQDAGSMPTATAQSTRDMPLEERQVHRVPLAQQIERIERGFAKAQEPPIHPQDPRLTPIAILPVVPDFTLWCNTYQEVIFDTDPAPKRFRTRRKRTRAQTTESSSPPPPQSSSLTPEEREQLTDEAIIKGFKGRNPHNEREVVSFVAYLVPNKRRKTTSSPLTTAVTSPTTTTISPAATDTVTTITNTNTNNSNSTETENEEQEYYWVREYNYQIKQSDGQDDYFFVFHDDYVTYAQLSQTVILQKMTTRTAEHDEDERSLSTEMGDGEVGEATSETSLVIDDNVHRVLVRKSLTESDESALNRRLKLRNLLDSNPRADT